MYHIKLNPTIFTKAPWNTIPETQRRTFVYVVDEAAGIAPEGPIFPVPSGGGLVNGAKYVQGQSTTRWLAIGINGERLDEDTLKYVFLNSAVGGGTMNTNLANAVQRGILIVTKDDGVPMTAAQLFAIANMNNLA